MKLLFFIAAGGAFGAIGRYEVMATVGQINGAVFPYGTILVNVGGSLALGAAVELMALIWSPSEEIKAFFVVGLLGAFTTFSAFSLDVVVLLKREELFFAALYVVVSVVLSVAAFFLATIAFRHIFT